MNCRECQSRLEELILGPTGRPADPNLSGVQEHLANCRACREALEEMKQIGRCASHIRQTAENWPRERVDALWTRTLDGIREQDAAAAGLRTAIGRPMFSSRFRPALGVAALVLAAVGTGLVLRQTGIRPEERGKAEPAAAAAVAGKTALVAAKPSVPTLAELTEEFLRLKRSDKGVDQGFIRKLAGFVAQERSNAEEGMKGCELLCQAYEEIGEKDLARQAFVKYLECVEGLKGRETAARQAQDRAATLFRAKDYLGGLAYYDLILTYYAETPQAPQARYAVGQYYEKLKVPERAVAEYEALVREKPENPWAQRAAQRIPMLLFNQGQKEKAIGKLKEFAAKQGTAEAEGYAHFQVGMIKYERGIAGYAEALKEFRAVVERYPEHRYAASARGMMNLINKRVLDLSTGGGRL